MARVKCPKCFTVNPDDQERCVKCGAPLPRIRISGPAPDAPKAPPPGQGPAGTGQINPGQNVAGRYTVLQLIGRGGMGCIYRVRDNTLNEEVALKTLLPQFVRDKMVVERFFNEARIARKLAHPNIVRVHDIGSAEGMVYISMELVRGQSLRNYMERLMPGTRLPPAEVLRVAEDLCVALEYAHQYTVHRDIKPENIMLDEKGVVKLMDFGISKLMANTRMTGASVVMGTPFYMSPEQLRNSRDVDARADIFSVGVVLYEILTGSVPTGVPKPPSVVVPDLPKRVDEVVGKCVEPDPAKRYQNASELRAAIRGLRQEMEQSGVAPVPTPKFVRGGVSMPQGLMGWLSSAACVAITAGALFAIEQGRAQTAAVAVAPQPAGAVDYLTLAGRARDKAQGASGSEAQRILADAERYWMAANDGGGDAAAEAALRAYLGVLMHAGLPEMVYIPGGPAQTGGSQVAVPAFFMDRREVSFAEFAAFCNEERWRSGVTAGEEMGALPAVNLTTYDAQAYAAAKGKRLPSSAQWSRAAQLDDLGRRYPWEGDYAPERCNCETGVPAPVSEHAEDITALGCVNMLGNVAEWTRDSRETGRELLFGDDMIVRGGSYESGAITLDAMSAMPFGSYRDDIGFRCVKEIPLSGPEVERYLAQ